MSTGSKTTKGFCVAFVYFPVYMSICMLVLLWFVWCQCVRVGSLSTSVLCSGMCG